MILEGLSCSNTSFRNSETEIETEVKNSPKILSIRAAPTFILGGGHGRFITARTCISNWSISHASMV